jgi:hypothetical protein
MSEIVTELKALSVGTESIINYLSLGSKYIMMKGFMEEYEFIKGKMDTKTSTLVNNEILVDIYSNQDDLVLVDIRAVNFTTTQVLIIRIEQ